MMQIAPTSPANLLVRLLSRRLSVPEFVAASLATILIFTCYCQLYCSIQFAAMRRLPMPLMQSITWSIAAVMPWLAGLEVLKRRHAWTHSTSVRRLAVIAICVAAVAASIVLELGLDQLTGVHTRPYRQLIASQLPPAAITAAVLWLFPAASFQSALPIAAPEPLQGVLAISSDIQWIEAAGNYVEIHTGSGVSLHRVTMRELELGLDRAVFRRIHRSVIVNINAVEGRVLIGSSPAVRVTDGTVLRIGSRYAANIS